MDSIFIKNIDEQPITRIDVAGTQDRVTRVSTLR